MGTSSSPMMATVAFITTELETTFASHASAAELDLFCRYIDDSLAPDNVDLPTAEEYKVSKVSFSKNLKELNFVGLHVRVDKVGKLSWKPINKSDILSIDPPRYPHFSSTFPLSQKRSCVVGGLVYYFDRVSSIDDFFQLSSQLFFELEDHLSLQGEKDGEE